MADCLEAEAVMMGYEPSSIGVSSMTFPSGDVAIELNSFISPAFYIYINI